MSGPRMRKRKPVRHKQVREVERQLEEVMGMDVDLSGGFIELAHFEGRDILLLDRTIVGIRVEIGDSQRWVPTIRGILHWNPDRCWAAVDDGATPFLLNGADCMGAGVHIADPSVEAGGFVWVRDQDRGTPISIGVALVDGDEMMEMTKGKAISTIHWVGDELWMIEA
ncbi:MAG: hypothetical protein CMB14_03910 [Euryarchaeota archaeon]|nr:hypothetical protein [Euryarchaeota archaeon]|tara:strand:+ start:535 stop:1038 length:504 start_codon:yes stop_codon:yes gene_type:complete